MNDDNPEYSELLVGKERKIDPTKNPNYRRFQGLSNLIKVLKRDQGITQNAIINESSDSHVLLYKNVMKDSFSRVINYYEGEIGSVKIKLEQGIKNV